MKKLFTGMMLFGGISLCIAASEKTVFFDDFSSGKLNKWTHVYKLDDWKVIDQALNCESYTGGLIEPAVKLNGNDKISFRIQRGLNSSADCHCGVKIYTADNKMTQFIIRGNFRYYRKGNKGESIIGNKAINLEFERWYRIGLESENGSVMVYVDGKKLGVIPGVKQLRKIKFYAFNQQIKLDDVKITELEQ